MELGGAGGTDPINIGAETSHREETLRSYRLAFYDTNQLRADGKINPLPMHLKSPDVCRAETKD